MENQPTKKQEINRKATQKWYQKNKEKASKLKKDWYAENKERLKKIHREWYVKNIEKERERSKKYYQDNKEKVIERNKDYRINLQLGFIKPKQKEMKESKEFIAPIYKQSEIIEVLKKDNRSPLWNKEIKKWDEFDWITFNKLKNG